MSDSTISLDDLNLDEAPSKSWVRGPTLAPFDSLVREVVPLEEGDLQALKESGPSRSQIGLKHIRAYHHMVALRLATGERPVQICAALGITPQTITKLRDSPQFMELVEGFREKLVEKAVDHFELMSLVSAESLTLLHQKLNDEALEDIPFETLRRLTETFVDRIGHSPIRRSESTNRHTHALDSGTIDRIKSLHGARPLYREEAISDAVLIQEPQKVETTTIVAVRPIIGQEPTLELEADPSSGEGEGL